MKRKSLMLITVVFAIYLTASCSLTLNGADSANAPKNDTQKTSDSADKKEKPDSSKKTDKKESVKNDAETSGSSKNDPQSEEEQIQFAKGETDTTLERTIAPGVSKTYYMNARKGQTMWFKVEESTNQLSVDFNRRSVELGEEVRESLDASGDWAIYINNTTDKTLKYTLWVGIE